MKRALATVFQFLVTATLLWWLFRDPEKRANMWEALSTARFGWLVVGLVIYSAVEVLGSYRWYLLLRVQQIDISFGRVLQIFMVGVFFNVFLPGAVGGDVVKIFYLLKETKRKKAAALLTVVMDRLLGLVALIAVTAVVLTPHWREFMAAPATRNLLYALLFIMANAAAMIVLSIIITVFGWVEKLPRKLPGRDKLVEISVAYSLYGRAWKSSLAGFLLSALAHVCFFSTFYCAARAFTGAVSWMNMMVVMPVVAVVTSLPISISGVGVREGLFEKLLGELYGVANDTAILISLTGFAIIVFWSAVGGVIYLFYRPSEHAGLHEIDVTVAEIEESITHPGESA